MLTEQWNIRSNDDKRLITSYIYIYGANVRKVWKTELIEYLNIK